MMRSMKYMSVVLLAFAAIVAGAQDPTRPSAAMAERLKARALEAQTLRVKALVVGAAEEGVALVGTDGRAAAPVRKGARLAETVDGVAVSLTVKGVTPAGVELETGDATNRLFLAGSFTPLALPADPPAAFIRHLEATEVPLDVLLRLVADQSGVNISSSDAAARKTASIFLRNVTAETAVEEICRTTGLWFRRESGSDVLRVTTMEEYTENLHSFREEKTEMFTLLYPNVIEVAGSIYGLYPDRTLLSLGEEEFDEDDEYDLSRRFRRFRVLEDNGGSQFLDMEPPDASSSSGSRSGSGTFSFSRGSGLSRMTQWDELAARSRRRNGFAGGGARLSASEARMLDLARLAGNTNFYESARGQALMGRANIFVTLSRKNNVLIVRTSDMRVMDEIRALVKKLDVPTPMVLMEVKVLELSIDDDFEAGVKWSLADYNSNHNPLSPRSDGIASHVLGHDGDHLANLAAATLAGSQPAIASTFAFEAVSDHVRARIELMQRDGKVRTLATPTLLTANNEVSRIFCGKEYPIVSGWTPGQAVANGLAGSTSVPATVQIEKKDVGTMLLITPNINADKTVTLRLLQENSSVSDQKVTIPVTGDETDAKPIEYVESRSLTGTFIAKDGMMVLAGGLVSEHEEETYWRTPVLGSIPGLGWLFRGTEKAKRRTELVVLIRPHVISTPVEGGRISKELLDRISAHPARDGRGSMMIHKAADGRDGDRRPRVPENDINALVK